MKRREGLESGGNQISQIVREARFEKKADMENGSEEDERLQ